MQRLLILLGAALIAGGCSQDQETAAESPASVSQQSQPTAPAEPTRSEAEKAAELYAAFFEESLKLNPLRATFMGDHRYNDQLPNFLSEESREEQKAFEEKWLARINEIDAAQLEGQDLLSYEMFKLNREENLEGMRFPGWMIPINQFFSIPNFMALLGSGTNAQPFQTVGHYEDWLKRIDGAEAIFDQAIENMRAGVEAGVVQPRVLMEKVIPQLEAHIVEDPEQSMFWRPVANMPEDFPEADRERLTAAYRTAISEQVIPMYTRLRDYIRDDYLEKARKTHGLWDLPDGEAWYAYNVKSTTTTDLSPEEIHQIGLDEVERIHGEMREVMEQVGFEGTLQEFFEFTKTDEQFIPETEETLMQAYEDLREVVDAKVDDLFSLRPKAGFEIRPVEAFRAQSASAASYQRPASDGSRPGVFYVNTYDLSSRPIWGVESLYLHEAIPGHHFQLAIQQELDELPKFRRFGGYTAFTEGWGLYAESLGKELGVYTDPYQYYGALNAELWRAIRLVVDTGLHYKRWTREDVLNYMEQNSAAGETRRVSEAERYIAIPSQALAYKVGQLKISELRARAEETLGEHFDIREFHAQVIGTGALPLQILENKIDRWIEAELAEAGET
ncbi:MAG: DUF885 domain-containing protein [Xanthomonadales bacterium]|nr:DUF885 domain-containing protein [Xanthomonadales bacterium]